MSKGQRLNALATGHFLCILTRGISQQRVCLVQHGPHASSLFDRSLATASCGRSLLSTYATSDIDEQAALFRGWNQTYNQLSSGSFNGSFSELTLPGLTIFREITSKSLHQTGEPGQDVVAAGIPLELEGTAYFCGRPCDGTQLHVFSGNDSFDFRSPSGLDIAGVVIERDQLGAFCSERERDDVAAALSRPHLRNCGPEEATRLRCVLISAFDAMIGTPHIADSPTLLLQLSRDIATALVDATHRDDTCDAVFLSASKRWQIARDARSLATDAPDGSMTVEDICEQLSVSRRTLQYCFQEALGVRPSTYLRAVRLNGARRTIKSGGSVTDAATTWGFWHFGRFSHDYKALFGELPSTTAQRHSPAKSPR